MYPWNMIGRGAESLPPGAEDLIMRSQDESKIIRDLRQEIASLKMENAKLRRTEKDCFRFSKEELEFHDRVIRNKARKEYRDLCRADLLKVYKEWGEEHLKQLNELWDKRCAEFKTGNIAEDYKSWMRIVMALPIKVLVEDFRWKPMTADCCGDKRQAIVKFCTRCADLMEDMYFSETKDLRVFADQVMNQTGAGFVFTEEDDE